LRLAASALVTMPSTLSAVAWLMPCCQPTGVPWPSMMVTFQPILAPASAIAWPHSRDASFCSSVDM
jgi:hypothetical protein